jgi:poly(3-hydroxybutyrate) depolymerase
VTVPDRGPPGALVSRSQTSPVEEQIVVNGGGRDIPAVVLLPADYDAAGAPRPLVVALHNFAGNAPGFADLIHADRLTARGIVVLLPQAGGRTAPDWQGPGLTLLGPAITPDGRRVNDIEGVARLIAVAQGLYRLKPDDVNVLGFSQGATLALALTRHLDAARPGAVRRLFLAAGSLASPPDDTLALQGTDIVAYEPGHNWLQVMADFRTGEPLERVFWPELLRIKGCQDDEAQPGFPGLQEHSYRCAGDTRALHIFEPDGEHAWPGQDARYDSWFTGRGSISKLDFTTLIADTIAPQ